MSGDDPLLALQPHLTSDNVHVVAKVANKIPLSKGGHLQPSNVFCTFAERLFWNKKQKVGKTMSKVYIYIYIYIYMCVLRCVCACVRACVHACVHLTYWMV